MRQDIPEKVVLDEYGWAINIPSGMDKIPISHHRENCFFIYEGRLMCYKSIDSDFLEEFILPERIVGLAKQDHRGLIVGEQNIYMFCSPCPSEFVCLGRKRPTRYYLAAPFAVCIHEGVLYCISPRDASGRNREYSADLSVISEKLGLPNAGYIEHMVDGAYNDMSEKVFILKNGKPIFYFNCKGGEVDVKIVVTDDILTSREKSIRLKPKKRIPFPSVPYNRSSQKSARKTVEIEP